MKQIIRAILLVVVGIVAIVLSCKCFDKGEYRHTSLATYGGDAYTGIQNAGARAANNTKELGELVQFGFGSVLMVMGLTLIAFGVTIPIELNKDDENINNLVEKIKNVFDKSNEEINDKIASDEIESETNDSDNASEIIEEENNKS